MKALVVSRSMKVTLFLLLALALLASLPAILAEMKEAKFEGKAKVREGGVQAANINASPIQPAIVAAAGPTGFTPQTRLGFNIDNEWEPAIAADRFGHVYMLYLQPNHDPANQFRSWNSLRFAVETSRLLYNNTNFRVTKKRIKPVYFILCIL